MSVRPDIGLERLIHGLVQELLEASDEEFVAGAHGLGMNPESKGSAAFAGVKNLSPQLLAALQRAHEERLQDNDQSATPEDQNVPGVVPRKRPKRNVDA